METPLPTLIEMFLADKRTEGKSNATVLWYQDKLTRFSNFCGNGEPLKLGQLTVDHAKEFIQNLQAKEVLFEDHPYRPKMDHGLSTHTIAGYARSLKAFSAWMKEEGFTETDLFDHLKRPKVSQPVIEVLNQSEVERIFDSINPNCFMGARLQLIVLLLLDTGMRAAELCHIKLSDVSFETDQILITGKGNKQRFVPFSPVTKKALMRFINTWRAEADNDYLILTEDGNPLNDGSLLQLIKRLGKRCGIPRLHPHLFRHSSATFYLINGGDLQSLRLLLGHVDISTTQLYLRLSNTQVQQQHHKFSPVNNLRLGRGRKLNKN